MRNQHNQVPYLTRNTSWESDKNTKKHNTQENEEDSPFPEGDHRAASNRQDDSITKINMLNNKKGIHERSTPYKQSLVIGIIRALG